MTGRDAQGIDEEVYESSNTQSNRLTVLLTSYEQINGEIRYFGNRLHQSYYLLISTTVLLVGLGLEKIVDLWLISIFGGIIYLVTGYMMFRFRVKQRSAQVLRRYIEYKISEGDIREVDRLLRIQKDIWANNTRWEDLEAHSLTHDRSDWEEFKTMGPILSAKTLSQILIVGGAIILITGTMFYLLY